MKKKYLTPEAEIIYITVDVITTSDSEDGVDWGVDWGEENLSLEIGK